MSSIEILCATMHQTDFSKIKSMNIHSDVIFANQADCNSFDELRFDDCIAKMITTQTRGVGLNRNIALLASTNDILLFADDDIFYYNDLDSHVLDAFNSFPEADVIVFGFDFSKNGVVYKTRCPKKGKLHFYESLKFGTVSLAIRRNSLLRANISFTQMFGGGCPYSHGEDSDFIIQCYKKKLNIFAFDYVLGCTTKDSSTCFFGYDEKYFYDTGALARHSFGIFSYAYLFYMAFRIKKDCSLSLKQKFLWLKYGYDNFKNGKSYSDFILGK